MKYVAYFVVGPESSGTKLVTDLLVKSGCLGSPDHGQAIDDVIDDPEKLTAYLEGVDKVVIRRSVPHGGKHPDIKGIYSALTDAGYAVRFVVTSRSWPTQIISHIDLQQHSPDKESAIESIRDATMYIYSTLKRLKINDWISVSFGDLLRNKTVVLHWLMSEVGLEYDSSLESTIHPEVEDSRVAEYRGGM